MLSLFIVDKHHCVALFILLGDELLTAIQIYHGTVYSSGYPAYFV